MPAFAATRLVNPADATPILTEQQLWSGIELKCRQPELFIKQVTSCKVTKDEGDKVRFLFVILSDF
jgi:hypothetical protein